MLSAEPGGEKGRELLQAVEATLAGDVDAFEAVVKAFHRSVRGYLAARGISEELDDLEQEVFIRVYRALPSYERTQPLWPWVRGVARNTALENFRRRAARARSEGDLIRERILRLQGQGGRWGEQAVDALKVCLAELGERARRVLSAHYARGLSSIELADAEGIGASAVRNVLCRAREALKGCIDRRLRAEGGHL